MKDLKIISQRIQKAVLAAVDPSAAVKRALALTQRGFAVKAGIKARELGIDGRLIVIAAGKASLAMAAAASDVLGSLVSEAFVVVPHGYPEFSAGIQGSRIVHAGVPVPDEHGREAARTIRALISRLDERDTCLFLISGGSSSLLPDPLPGVSLDDLIETTSLFLKTGADIQELNTVRKHLSAFSGGRLAQSCRGTLVTLAISDVVGDDISVVGSGPTVPDPSTYSDALGLLSRFGLTSRVPASVRETLERGAAALIEESPKALSDRHAALIVASGSLAVDAAAAEARVCGFAPLVLTASMKGEAREAGRHLASVARESRLHGLPVPAPACIIAAGETTVTVTGDGTGGRNQEIALAAALEMRDEQGILLTSFATDGKEGNSEAAGAYASGATAAAGERAGQDGQSCLARNDAHAFLGAAGELIVTGPTGTNVNDISFVLVDKI